MIKEYKRILSSKSLCELEEFYNELWGNCGSCVSKEDYAHHIYAYLRQYNRIHKNKETKERKENIILKAYKIFMFLGKKI